MTPQEIGWNGGIITLSVTPASLYALSWLGERLDRGRRGSGLLAVTIVMLLLHLVPAIAMLIVPTQRSMWLCFTLAAALTSPMSVLAANMLSEITPAHLIGRATSLFNLLIGVIGFSAGPMLFALVATNIDPASIDRSMLLCYPTLMIGSVAFLLALRVRIDRHLT